jgi:hypothetical protein
MDDHQQPARSGKTGATARGRGCPPDPEACSAGPIAGDASAPTILLLSRGKRDLDSRPRVSGAVGHTRSQPHRRSLRCSSSTAGGPYGQLVRSPTRGTTTRETHCRGNPSVHGADGGLRNVQGVLHGGAVNAEERRDRCRIMCVVNKEISRHPARLPRRAKSPRRRQTQCAQATSPVSTQSRC